jgi:hypothetical protein
MTVHDGRPETPTPTREVVAVRQPDMTFRVLLPDGRVLGAIDEERARRLIWREVPGARVLWATT